MTIKQLKYILGSKDLQEEILKNDENSSIIFTDIEIIITNVSEQECFNAQDEAYYRQKYDENHPEYIEEADWQELDPDYKC